MECLHSEAKSRSIRGGSSSFSSSFFCPSSSTSYFCNNPTAAVSTLFEKNELEHRPPPTLSLLLGQKQTALSHCITSISRLPPPPPLFRSTLRWGDTQHLRKNFSCSSSPRLCRRGLVRFAYLLSPFLLPFLPPSLGRDHFRFVLLLPPPLSYGAASRRLERRNFKK